MTAEDQKMLTLNDAAAELGMGISTLHRYIRNRGLKTYRKPGDRRGYLRAADVEQLKGFTPKEEKSEPTPQVRKAS